MSRRSLEESAIVMKLPAAFQLGAQYFVISIRSRAPLQVAHYLGQVLVRLGDFCGADRGWLDRLYAAVRSVNFQNFCGELC